MENSTTNKPGTATIGVNSKAQNCKRGRFGAQFFPKYGKKLKGPFGDIRNFREKLMVGFLNSVTLPKNVNGDPLEFLPLLAKYRKQMKGDPLLQ